MSGEEYTLGPVGLYDMVSVCIGVLGAVVTATLIVFGVGMVLAMSVGLNASLFVWAYTLWEGWHEHAQHDGVEV